MAPRRAPRLLAAGYIQLIQGTPLLVLMGLCFFGPSLFGLGELSALAAAALAMTIYSSAFLGEIWRGCIQAVPRNQWEAAECLGLSRLQRMGKVILPQALRIATPPTVGFLVQIIKNTSIASLVIGYSELAYNAKILNNSTFQPFIYFGCAAILFRHVLSAVALEPLPGEETQCIPWLNSSRSTALRQHPCAARHQLFRGRGRGGGPDRQERLGQEHGAALHGPAGNRRRRRDPRLRPRAARRRRPGPARCGATWASCSRATTCSRT